MHTLSASHSANIHSDLKIARASETERSSKSEEMKRIKMLHVVCVRLPICFENEETFFTFDDSTQLPIDVVCSSRLPAQRHTMKCALENYPRLFRWLASKFHLIFNKVYTSFAHSSALRRRDCSRVVIHTHTLAVRSTDTRLAFGPAEIRISM